MQAALRLPSSLGEDVTPMAVTAVDGDRTPEPQPPLGNVGRAITPPSLSANPLLALAPSAPDWPMVRVYLNELLWLQSWLAF